MVTRSPDGRSALRCLRRPPHTPVAFVRLTGWTFGR